MSAQSNIELQVLKNMFPAEFRFVILDYYVKMVHPAVEEILKNHDIYEYDAADFVLLSEKECKLVTYKLHYCYKYESYHVRSDYRVDGTYFYARSELGDKGQKYFDSCLHEVRTEAVKEILYREELEKQKLYLKKDCWFKKCFQAIGKKQSYTGEIAKEDCLGRKDVA